MDLYILLIIIAFLYASVGHGGASGYIALMAIFAFPQGEIKTNALMMNIVVSGIAFWHFFRKDTFPYKLFLLLSACSMPMAFLGGMLSMNDRIFKIILGLILLIPIAKFFGILPPGSSKVIPKQWYYIVPIGMGIGLLSGLMGIGGGIILSPVLLLLGWCDIKQTSAVSALFIFVNSGSGLLGKSLDKLEYSDNIPYLILFTLIGGFMGSYFGSYRFKTESLKKILASVLVIACYKLWFT